MSSRELDFPKASQWVLARCAALTTEKDVTDALHALAHAATQADADCVLDDLFPGSKLEVLFLRSSDADVANMHLPPKPAVVELTAMTAIGRAIVFDMEKTGKRILTFIVDNCGEIIVFSPDMRDVVLMGTRTTVLSS